MFVPLKHIFMLFFTVPFAGGMWMALIIAALPATSTFPSIGAHCCHGFVTS